LCCSVFNAKPHRPAGALSPDWPCSCVNQVIDADTIVVNHTLTQNASVTEQIERTVPGMLLSDGGFVWGCPTSTLWTAVTYGLSFLAVVFNNQGYGVARGSQKEVMGVDSLTEEYTFEAGVEFMPDYAMIARACRASGRTVEDPSEVLPTLEEALGTVRAGRAAVLDVRLGRE